MTLMPRLIPVLQIIGSSAVKTTQFQHPRYIGSALNTLRVFSDQEADEVVVIDLSDGETKASQKHWDFLEMLAGQAGMPVSYGGRIADMKTSRALVRLGFEKVVLGRACYSRPNLADEVAAFLGRQAVVRAIDVLETGNEYKIATDSQKLDLRLDDLNFELICGDEAYGELLVTSVTREGMRCGLDHALVRWFAHRVSTPLLVNGGLRSVEDAIQAVSAGASGVAAGDLSVNLQHGRAVLAHLPCGEELTKFRTRQLGSTLGS